MKFKANLILIVLFLLFLFNPNNSWALFEQNFALPIEGGTKLGQAVNSYFNDFVSNSLYQGLLKAGFLLAVLIAIFKYGFRVDHPFRDFLVYVMTLFFIVMPLPGGKTLPVMLVDSLDNLTNSIIIKLGHYPALGGQGVMLATAENFARNYAYSRNAWYAKGVEDCYQQVVADAARQGKPAPSLLNRNSDGSYNLEIYNNFTTSVVPKQISYVRIPVGNMDCKGMVQSTIQSLQASYKKGLDEYIRQAEKMGLPTDKLKTNFENLYKNADSESLLKEAVKYANRHPEAVEQNKTPNGWEIIRGMFKSFFTADGIQSLLLFVPRLLISVAGVLALYFFDYYVYHIGALIKIAASIGIALGVLFFVFLGRISFLVESIGAWMFANATYIIASIIMANFWDKVDKNLGSMFLFILGQPGPLTEAYFMLGFSLMLYTTLAGIITWRGVSLSVKMPNVITPFAIKKL